MEITISQLQRLLESASEIGAKRALAEAGLIKPYLKKSEAYRMYGKANVERWLREGLLKPRKDGRASASWRLERAELESIAKASNRASYLTVQEINQKTPV